MLVVKQKGRATSNRSQRRLKTGGGIINSLINKLPFELHLPGGYQYCGPGTKLRRRLARGDPGINPLDVACKSHDIAYLKNADLDARHKADYELENRAWERVKSTDASTGEKAAAWLVTNIMKGKQRFGMGCLISTKKRNKKTKKGLKGKKGRKVSFSAGILRKVREVLKKSGGKDFIAKDAYKASEVALHAARQALRGAGGEKKIRTPRVLPIPKVGGILPLLPIFAGLSALGALAGGAAGISKVITDVKLGRQRLAESERHNKNMEAIAIGKSGKGLYLKPYRKGLGLYLKSNNSKNY